VCVFVWVGSVDPKTEYIWSCGHIAEPGARASIHLPFPLSVFLPDICLHMQDCLQHACCFHAINQVPHEACNECVKQISGDAAWKGNVTFERARNVHTYNGVNIPLNMMSMFLVSLLISFQA